MYKRICIFGRPGSGKSTFALQLHRETSFPLYHLDRFFYNENWVERDHQEFLKIQRSFVEQERWIIDGNSLQSLEMRYEKADICLYFNYPRTTCLMRLLKRRFFKDASIQDRANGCKENIRWRLITYMWNFETRKNNRLKMLIAQLSQQYPEVRFLEIKNDTDMQAAHTMMLANTRNT